MICDRDRDRRARDRDTVSTYTSVMSANASKPRCHGHGWYTLHASRLRSLAILSLPPPPSLPVTSVTHPLLLRAAHLVAQPHQRRRRLGLRIHDVAGRGPHEVRRERGATPRHVEHEARGLQVPARVSVDLRLLSMSSPFRCPSSSRDRHRDTWAYEPQATHETEKTPNIKSATKFR